MRKLKIFTMADFLISAGTISFFSAIFFVENIKNFRSWAAVGTLISVIATIYFIISITTYFSERHDAKMDSYDQEMMILETMKTSGQLTEEEYNKKRMQLMEEKW